MAITYYVKRDELHQFAANRTGPNESQSESRPRPLLGELTVAQRPVLPQLQRRQQHDRGTEADMPLHELTGVTEDERRDDQPQPERHGAEFLPARQTHQFELGEQEHHRADQDGVRHHQLIALQSDKPGRQPDQHTEHDAGPIFPGAVNAQQPNACHGRLPLFTPPRPRRGKSLRCPILRSSLTWRSYI